MKTILALSSLTIALLLSACGSGTSNSSSSSMPGMTAEEHAKMNH